MQHLTISISYEDIDGGTHHATLTSGVAQMVRAERALSILDAIRTDVNTQIATLNDYHDSRERENLQKFERAIRRIETQDQIK